MEKEKMAKSSGNFTTLSTLTERGFHPLDYRYFCLGAHYRTQLAFSWEAMESSRAGRQGLQEKILQLREQAGQAAANPQGKAAEYLRDFDVHAADDLNMPRCLADLWTLLRDPSVAAADKLGVTFHMDKILGLGLEEARAREVELDAEARGLVEQREAARKARDYKKADEIRALLLEKGIEVQDGPKGPKVRFAAGQRQ
jgi:cysteinyl-tRNA synthetase